MRTFLNEKDELVHVQVNGETITCTTEHPFYVQGKGWIAAKDLKIGDKLELQNGEDAFVDTIRREKLAEPIQVFNFEVEDFHTYYVGAGCVLVHNMCTNNASKYGHYEIDYSDGTKYVGKGSPARMNVSARQHTYNQAGESVRAVVNKQWYPSTSNDMAFVDEYQLMKKYGFGSRGHNLLNQIQSPGLNKAIRMGLKI